MVGLSFSARKVAQMLAWLDDTTGLPVRRSSSPTASPPPIPSRAISAHISNWVAASARPTAYVRWISPGRSRVLLPAPLHVPQRLVDPGERRDRYEPVVPLLRDVHLLREVEEDVRRVLHQELRELRIVLLALGLHVRASRRLQLLV